VVIENEGRGVRRNSQMFKQDNLLVDSEVKLQGRVTLHHGSAAPQQTLQHILIALFCLSKEKKKSH